MRAPTVSILLATLLGGCGGVLSRNPASDGATTKDDERLVGFWYVEDQAPGSGRADPSHDASILVVGRKAAGERSLELVGVTLKRDTTLDVLRGEALATTIGAKDYASTRFPREDSKPSDGAAWSVVRYDMPDGDTLRVLGMEEKTVASDVRAGKIPGSVSESKEPPGVEPKITVTLETSTAVLRAYLEQRGDGVFGADKPLVLRRLRTK